LIYSVSEVKPINLCGPTEERNHYGNGCKCNIYAINWSGQFAVKQILWRHYAQWKDRIQQNDYV